jgi:hypothetical protein
MFNNPRLKSGSAEIFIPVGKSVTIESTNVLQLSTVSPDGEIVPFKMVDGRFVFKSPGQIIIDTPEESDIWYINYQTPEITFDKADPVPVEAAITEAPTMMERMQALIRQEVLNRYGAGSDEVETMEEAMDFDIDGDGIIGSQYEVMEEEYLSDQGGYEPTATSEGQSPDVQPTSETTTVETESPPPVEGDSGSDASTV